MKTAENSRRMSKNARNTALDAAFTFAKDEWTPTAAASRMTIELRRTQMFSKLRMQKRRRAKQAWRSIQHSE
jgi:hypothetical protein